jgi:hypothetical protein
MRILSEKELETIYADYVAVFPDWQKLPGQLIARTFGPIIQHIGLEPLQSGEYRPWSGIRCLPRPAVRMLHQFLDVKHRQASLREHPRMFKNMVSAMERQFLPSIRKPLDLGEVRTLCEKAARNSTNDVCMLAVLNAYLGKKRGALDCCERMQTLPAPTLAPRLDWEAGHKQFALQLMSALNAGTEFQYLEAAAALTPKLS